MEKRQHKKAHTPHTIMKAQSEHELMVELTLTFNFSFIEIRIEGSFAWC